MSHRPRPAANAAGLFVSPPVDTPPGAVITPALNRPAARGGTRRRRAGTERHATPGHGRMADATARGAPLTDGIRRFADARGWEPYHTPKNLVLALASEVGELCEVFRWLTPEESRAVPADPKLREAVADELADVANIVFLLSEHTGIDLSEAIRAKMAKNAVKYPAPAPPSGDGGGPGGDAGASPGG